MIKGEISLTVIDTSFSNLCNIIFWAFYRKMAFLDVPQSFLTKERIFKNFSTGFTYFYSSSSIRIWYLRKFPRKFQVFNSYRKTVYKYVYCSSRHISCDQFSDLKVINIAIWVFLCKYYTYIRIYSNGLFVSVQTILHFKFINYWLVTSVIYLYVVKK